MTLLDIEPNVFAKFLGDATQTMYAMLVIGGGACTVWQIWRSFSKNKNIKDTAEMMGVQRGYEK